MKPHELIEAQRELVIRASERIPFQRFLGALLANSFEHGARYGALKTTETDPRVLGPQIGRHLGGLVRGADLYQVTEDMTPLVVHAASGLNGTDQWSRHNAPSPVGMARFERPLAVTDVWGDEMLLHWVIWGPMQTSDGISGTALYMFNDTWTEPDEVQRYVWDQKRRNYGEADVQQIKDIQGRWAFLGIDFMTEGQRLGPPTSFPSEEYQARIIAEGQSPGGATSLHRLIHALFLLLNQTIVARERPEIPRSHLKIARRMKMPGQITVVMLRRFQGARYEGESYVEWSHRWVVKGHWRWQACGPHLSERRRIWIAPYIKGPDGKPLVIPDKVYRLAR